MSIGESNTLLFRVRTITRRHEKVQGKRHGVRCTSDGWLLVRRCWSCRETKRSSWVNTEEILALRAFYWQRSDGTWRRSTLTERILRIQSECRTFHSWHWVPLLGKVKSRSVSITQAVRTDHVVHGYCAVLFRSDQMLHWPGLSSILNPTASQVHFQSFISIWSLLSVDSLSTMIEAT